MAYLTRQQTLKQWAGLVTQAEVTNLKQIQQVQFTSKLLLNLDPEYFKKVISSHSKGMTFSQLFTQISQYYSREIGTNIQKIMGEDANIYSTTSIQQIWQLILGIAIKGRNRQKNINTILKMRPQTQQQLMRIISKLINRLGENVSVIDGSTSQIVKAAAPISSNDADLIIQLSEQNEQLKEKIQQFTAQLNSLGEKNKSLKAEIQERNSQKRQIINLMIKEPISSKFSFSSSSSQSHSDVITEFIKDMISQVNTLTKQLNKKQQKQQYYQDVNRDLKVAYTTIALELQHVKNSAKDSNVDVIQIEKQIQQLRSENLQYAEREKDFLTRIGDLQQQKFYLKGIVQRLEAKNNISQQKIEKIIKANKVIPTAHFQQEPIEKQVKRETESFINQPVQESQKRNNLITVKKQLDETNQPSLKNKLQREVSHLQKKLNSLQDQNNSLKKINSILEKVINDFTKQSGQMMQKYESQIEPIFNQFEQIIKQQQKNRNMLEKQLTQKQIQNEQKIKQIMQKIKQKMQDYDRRQIQYQKIIKIHEIQRDQLLKMVKVYEQTPIEPKIVIQKPKPKPKKQLNFQVSIAMDPLSQKRNQQKSGEKEQIQKNQQYNQSKSQKQVQIQEQVQVQKQEQKQIKQENVIIQQQTQDHLSVQKNQNQIAASIIMQDEDEDLQGRRRQYSFMANKQSAYHFGDGDLGFKQKTANINRISSLGSCIEEQSLQKFNQSVENLESQMMSLGHVEIIDITQIEQQLMKIKQHYIGISQQGELICQTLINKSNAVGKKQNDSKIIDLVKNYEQLSKKQNKQQVQPKIQQYLKQFESLGVDKAKLTAQNIRMKQENTALRKHLSALNRERKAVEQRLIFLHHQSSKSHDQKTKQQMIRLSSAINEIRAAMTQSQNMYLQLQDYMEKSLGEESRQVEAMAAQVQQLTQALKQREYAIAHLETESRLLMGAVLEFRNSTVRSS